MIFDIATFKIKVQCRQSALLYFPDSVLKSYNRFILKHNTQSDFIITILPYNSFSLTSIKFTRREDYYYYRENGVIFIKSRVAIASINVITKTMSLGYKSSTQENKKISVLMAFVRLAASVCAVEKGGLPFHSSAIAFGDCGIAFSGPSSAGKSTIANLLISPGELLNDDFNIILPHLKNRYRIYATPFAHEKTLKKCVNRSANLQLIFFIEKNSSNKIEELLIKKKHLLMLGQTLFLPLSDFYWNKIFENTERLCKSVDCKLLYFQNNKTIRPLIYRYAKGLL